MAFYWTTILHTPIHSSLVVCSSTFRVVTILKLQMKPNFLKRYLKLRENEIVNIPCYVKVQMSNLRSSGADNIILFWFSDIFWLSKVEKILKGSLDLIQSPSP